MSRAQAIPKRACVVTIGYMRLLMPAEAGMKIIGLLQQAEEAGQTFGESECFFYPKGQPTLELEMLRPNQLKVAPPTAKETPARRPPGPALVFDGGQA